MNSTRPPVWAVQYKRKFGVWPIAGGSDTSTVENPNPSAPGVDPASGLPDAQRTVEQRIPGVGSETPPPASEGNGRQQPRDPETGRFTTEDIEKARREEKDKLYGRIEQMASELEELRKDREERQRQEEEAQKAAEEEARKRAEEEMSAKELVEKANREWQERFAALEREREAERAILEKEREFSVLQDFKNRRLTEEQDHIAPELMDYISGTTAEEIEESINRAKEKTARIIEQVSQAGVATRAGMRGTSVTAPPVGPMDEQSAQESVSAQDVAQMDMSTYMKKREALLQSLYRQTREQGLYG